MGVCVQAGEGEAENGGGEDEDSLLRVPTGAGCLTGRYLTNITFC